MTLTLYIIIEVHHQIPAVTTTAATTKMTRLLVDSWAFLALRMSIDMGAGKFGLNAPQVR
jgi:hypothetical protein